jgi:alkanesulfonate monooxygenase SsuD/methylene tetrahydromethanopterin reductase-like flavin-dependent oxidoreductase (luciferase family)
MGLIREAGFITAGTYPDADPAAGLEAHLQLFEWGEQLGFDTAGVRERHLEHGVSSAATFLAAATQRTRTITLESDVFPLGLDNPFRVAEAVATIAALAPGRFNIGISVSAPHADLLEPLAVPFVENGHDRYDRAAKFLAALRGDYLGEPNTTIDTPDGPQRPRIQPVIPGIIDDVWFGGGSDASIQWAARKGLSLLLGNLTYGGDHYRSFRDARLAQLDLYHREFAGKPRNRRLGVERVIVPLDGADEPTRQKYRAFKAQRDPRTLQPFGPRHILAEPDLVGFADEIVEDILGDPVFDGETRLRVALPYSFEPHEYRQILQDIAERVLPHVGWTPRSARPATHPPRALRANGLAGEPLAAHVLTHTA